MRCEAWLVVALTLVGAGTASAEVARVRRGGGEPLDATFYAGWYRGLLHDGLRERLVATRIAPLADHRNVRGSYFFYDDRGPQHGRLDTCRAPAPFELVCRWHDVYGSGDFVVRFEPGMNGFDGHWGSDGDGAPSLSWNGSRIECSEAQQARRFEDVEPAGDGADEICTLD